MVKRSTMITAFATTPEDSEIVQPEKHKSDMTSYNKAPRYRFCSG